MKTFLVLYMISLYVVKNTNLTRHEATNFHFFSPNLPGRVGVKWENLKSNLNPAFNWEEEIKKIVGGHHSFHQVNFSLAERK